MTNRLEALDLRGARVGLRPVERADARNAYDYLAGCEEVLRWLVWGGPRSLHELERRYAEWRLDDAAPDGPSDYQLAVEVAGELVGGLTLRFRGHPGQGDLGYWIAPPHQGNGYAKEAVRLATWLGFHHLEAGVLYGWVFVGNEPSRRVLEANGYALEHTVRGKLEPDGRVLDEWYFVQSRWDWGARDEPPPSEARVVRGSEGRSR